ILNNGNVGIGSIIPQYALDVYGTIRGFNVNPSDARFKQNIAPINGALDKVRRLRGVSFDWRQDEFPKRNFPPGRQLGFIAQEIKAVLPEVVSQDSEGYYSVDYGKLAPLLVEAIKEQQLRLDEQARKKDTEIQQLRESLAELKEQISRVAATQNRMFAEHAEHPND
ncbi:MAG TPA: tail fiber domain-containing protein, partial [Verrucomicrobiae bacterium]|nr:tail fiber domain-containing protein [Verrucomicrobiae bacterium]